MNDSISRQAVIDAIVAWTCQDRPDVEMPTDLIDRINTLPSAESEQRWIPCNERLPDKEGHYLVTDYAGGVYAIDIDDFFYYEDGESDWMFSQNVIAWMPLPEPYKEA